MPKKKTTEPEGIEQATGMEQSGLTGENVDAAAIPDETASAPRQRELQMQFRRKLRRPLPWKQKLLARNHFCRMKKNHCGMYLLRRSSCPCGQRPNRRLHLPRRKPTGRHFSI